MSSCAGQQGVSDGAVNGRGALFGTWAMYCMGSDWQLGDVSQSAFPSETDEVGSDWSSPPCSLVMGWSGGGKRGQILKSNILWNF